MASGANDTRRLAKDLRLASLRLLTSAAVVSFAPLRMDLTEGNADYQGLDKKYIRTAAHHTLRRFPAFSFRMLDEAGPMLRLRDFLDRLGDIEKELSVTDGKKPSVMFSLSASVAIIPLSKAQTRKLKM